MHIIAADVGGTKTRLAFANSKKPQQILYEARYLSTDFDAFEPMLNSFIKECGSSGSDLDTLSLALPGLVNQSSARLTNLPWTIEKQSLKNTFDIENIYFLNDFQASAFGTSQLYESDWLVLNHGVDSSTSENVIRLTVGAGTGLGVAWAETRDNEICTYATEGGHIDFAAVNELQIELLQFLKQRFNHVSYERILSGDGLVSLYHFFAGTESKQEDQTIDAEWVNQQASTNVDAEKALSLFVQIYGAYIGNLAMLYKPFGGIYITGGIAAKMVNKMQSKLFIESYCDKGRMQSLVEQIPVYLVTNDRVGVLGALSQAINNSRI